MELKKINIEDFKNQMYDEYTKLFPEDEQRDWEDIEKSYYDGVEILYGIIENEKNVGFIMLEKLNEDYPYYIDFFAIFEKYQGNNYGTMALEYLIKNIIKDTPLCLEIEKETEKDINTIRRAKFYRNLGFKKINSEYLFFGVRYTPYVYDMQNRLEKSKVDTIMLNYYKNNCGFESIINNFEIIY